MPAPTELRLAFWTELGDYVRNMNLPPADVLAPAGLGNYLWPREAKPPVRTALVRALVHGGLNRDHAPFLYWLAIHHLAPMTDLAPAPVTEAASAGMSAQESAAALLLYAAPQATVDWLSYNQPAPPAAVVLPPACYDVVGDVEVRARAVAAAAGVVAEWEVRLMRDTALAALLRGAPAP